MHILCQVIHKIDDRRDVIVMCGISGMIGLDHDDEIVKNMLTTMRRRGPDSSGVYRSVGTVLLHSRLAVIDPMGGRQPMVLQDSGVPSI